MGSWPYRARACGPGHAFRPTHRQTRSVERKGEADLLPHALDVQVLQLGPAPQGARARRAAQQAVRQTPPAAAPADRRSASRCCSGEGRGKLCNTAGNRVSYRLDILHSMFYERVAPSAPSMKSVCLPDLRACPTLVNHPPLVPPWVKKGAVLWCPMFQTIEPPSPQTVCLVRVFQNMVNQRPELQYLIRVSGPAMNESEQACFGNVVRVL